MRLKRIVSTLMAAVLSVGLVACGSSAPASSAAPAAAAAPAAEAAAATYEWPTQPVNVMCPAKAGGGTDMMLRLINEHFTKRNGQSFVINNVTGLTGYEQVHQGSTDGYDFIAGTTTIFTSKVDGSLDYDWSDYEMVAYIDGDFTTCIAVQADSPYQTIKDLLDAAAADPASVTGGITLSGQPYMFAKALKAAVGIDLYYVDTGTTSERNAALLGGQVDYIITNTASSQAYVESGDFRFLAIDGNDRYELAPDIPTFKEQGVDFCFAAQPIVWLAPKGTPKEACEAMNAQLAAIYADPAFAEAYKAMGFLPKPVPSIEESIVKGQAFADLLAPYVG